MRIHPNPPTPGGTLGSLSRDEGSCRIIALPPADKVGLQLDAVGVFTSLGLNERLFAVSVEELGGLVSTGTVLGGGAARGWELLEGNSGVVRVLWGVGSRVGIAWPHGARLLPLAPGPSVGPGGDGGVQEPR